MIGQLRRWLGGRTGVLGLEVGASAVKLVELAGTPPRLAACSIRPTPAGVMRDGVLADPAVIAEEIRRGVGEAKIKSKTVVIGAPNQVVLTRTINVPKMRTQELAEAVKWEAERYIPLPLDEVVWDFAVVHEVDAQTVEVLVAVAQQEVVLRYVEAIQLAGLDPYVVDIKPFAALRALGFSRASVGYTDADIATNEIKNRVTDKGRDKPIDEASVSVVLEIGASSTAIVLVRGDRVLMYRNLHISGDDFTIAIQKAFELDFMNAEELKIKVDSMIEEEDLLSVHSSEELKQIRILEAIQPVLNALITEIRRSIEFHRISEDFVLNKLCLCGGGAKLRGLVTALSDALAVHVELGDPWSALQAGDVQEKWRSFGPELVVPIGLALHGLSSSSGLKG